MEKGIEKWKRKHHYGIKGYFFFIKPAIKSSDLHPKSHRPKWPPVSPHFIFLLWFFICITLDIYIWWFPGFPVIFQVLVTKYFESREFDFISSRWHLLWSLRWFNHTFPYILFPIILHTIIVPGNPLFLELPEFTNGIIIQIL